MRIGTLIKIDMLVLSKVIKTKINDCFLFFAFCFLRKRTIEKSFLNIQEHIKSINAKSIFLIKIIPGHVSNNHRGLVSHINSAKGNVLYKLLSQKLRENQS